MIGEVDFEHDRFGRWQVRIFLWLFGVTVAVVFFAFFTTDQTNAQSVVGQKQITKQEWERRIKVCFALEDWLGPACIKELKTYQVIEARNGRASTTSTAEQFSSLSIDELHIVGVHEAAKASAGSGDVLQSEVLVRADRSGSSIALVLTSDEPVRWKVYAEPKTEIVAIIVSGDGAERSEVVIDDPAALIELRALGSTYRRIGIKFQQLHKAATELFGLKNAASFQGDYYAPDKGFLIVEAPGIPSPEEVQARLARLATDPMDLSEEMRTALTRRARSYNDEWKLGDYGFETVDPDGTLKQINLPLDFPPIENVIGSAYDNTANIVWGMSKRGPKEYLYEYAIEPATWAVKSIEGLDDGLNAGGLIFDVETGHFITTPSRNSIKKGRFAIVDQSARVVKSVEISFSDFPGLNDTFDPENGPAPVIRPLLVEGAKILVRAISPPHLGGSRLHYLVDLETANVELIRY